MADTTALTAGLTRASGQMSAFQRRSAALGKYMTKYVTLPILAIGAASVKFSLDFEKSMTDVEALVGMSAKEVAGFKEEILKLAPAVGKSPKELGEAFYFIASSGLKGKAAMEALTASAQASAAGLGETATVADAVTSAINAYGEATLSAVDATDVLLAAVREGKSEPEEFASSIGRVIPLASKMGVTFGEVSGIMAAMSLNGTDANQAVTEISAILSSSIKPNTEGAKVLDSIGMSYADLRDEIKNKGLTETVSHLDTAFKGNIETLGKLFPNIRALRGILALTGPEAEKYAEIIDKVSNAQGDAAKAFDIAKTKPGFKMKQAWGEIQVALIKIGDVLVPAAANIAKAVGSIAGAFSKLGPAGTTAVLAFGGVLAAAGPVLTILSKISTLRTGKALRGLGAAGGRGGLANVVADVAGSGVGTGKVPARVFSVGKSGAANTVVTKGERTVATSLLAGKGTGVVPIAAAGGLALPVTLVAVSAAAGFALAMAVAKYGAKPTNPRQQALHEGAINPHRGGQGTEEAYAAWAAKRLAARLKAEAKSVQVAVDAAVTELSAQAVTQTGEQFHRTLQQLGQLHEIAAKKIVLGNVDGKHTDGQLRTARDRLMGTLDITIKQADRLMASMFKDWRPQDQLVPKIDKAAAAVENRIAALRRRAAKDLRMGNLDATQLINEIGRVSAALGGVHGAARTAGNAVANAMKGSAGGGGSYRGHFMASGGDFMVNKPTLFVAGEAGPERATFTPKGKMPPGTSGGTVVNINIANVNGTDHAAARKFADMVGGILMQQVRFA